MFTPASSSFQIGHHTVGAGSPVFVIAEIAQAHDGSLGQAHAYIDAVAETGAQAIKFQTHIANAESSPEELFRVPFSFEDKTRFDYWKRMEFTPDQWAGLKKHAEERGLIFLSTPFSFEAVNLLRSLGVSAWKVGSGETDNLPMLEAMAQDGKPILLSTGLSSWEDIETSVDLIRSFDNSFAVFQCTSAYPCPAENLGFNILHELRARFNCPVGLSDHSGDIYASLGAAALGADIIELHAVFSKHCFGPDTRSSVTIEGLKKVVEGSLFIRKALLHPIDKDALANQNASLKIAFGKSLFAARNMSQGEALQSSDILFKKPGTGIPARDLKDVIGRRLGRSIIQGQKLCYDDFDS
jgi:N-acetylneuraminate synthase